MLVRVTEPLNYFKEPWYIDWVHKVGRTEANKIAKAAMKVGSKIDEIIKANTFDHVVLKSDEERNALLAFQKWKMVYQPKSIIPGTRLFATINGVEVTGEPDIFVDDVLVDIKCSSKISPSYWVQVNMYAYLRFKAKETSTLESGKVGILRLDKVSGSYEYIVKDFDIRLVEVWMGLLNAYVYFKGDEHDGVEL